MLDLKLTLDSTGQFDLSIENGNLAKVSGFDTALTVSLFTDARANEAQVYLPENRRGWVGNTVNEVQGRQLGGLLWLIDQRKLTQDTLNKSIDYAKKSLNWIIEDGIADNITVTGEIIPQRGIQLKINIHIDKGTTETHFVRLWEVTGDAN
jgi:phage gp46-like protein